MEIPKNNDEQDEIMDPEDSSEGDNNMADPHIATILNHVYDATKDTVPENDDINIQDYSSNHVKHEYSAGPGSNDLKIDDMGLNKGEEMYYKGLNMLNQKGIEMWRQVLDRERECKKQCTHRPKINKSNGVLLVICGCLGMNTTQELKSRVLKYGGMWVFSKK